MLSMPIYIGLIGSNGCGSVCKKIKTPLQVFVEAFFGGLKRIRTAVRGFADLCLATRPSDHFYPFYLFGCANIVRFYFKSKKNCIFTVKFLKFFISGLCRW